MRHGSSVIVSDPSATLALYANSLVPDVTDRDLEKKCQQASDWCIRAAITPLSLFVYLTTVIIYEWLGLLRCVVVVCLSPLLLLAAYP